MPLNLKCCRMSYVSQAGSDLVQLDSEINQVQAVLEALHQKREALLMFTAEHNAILAPIRRLPLELLIDIFIRCSPPSPLWHGQEAPSLCAQVCAGWRQAAVSTQPLWSSIRILYHGCLNVALFKTWLSWANSCALSVSIVFRQWEHLHVEHWQQFSSLIDLVVGHCDCWQDIRLCLPPSRIHDLGKSVKHCLSKLELIDISNSDSISPWLELDAFEYAPRLRTIRFKPVGIPVQHLRIPWSQIKLLILMIRDVTECLESLQMVSNHRLFMLIIHAETWGGPRVVSDSRRFPTIWLPYLNTLHIMSVDQPDCLFDHLELPVLNTISTRDVRSSLVEGLWLSHQPSLSLLSRCSCTLRKLVITDAHTLSRDISNLGLVLHAIPLLTELVVRRAPGLFSADVLNRLTQHKNTEVKLAPCLKVLNIKETYTSLPIPLFADMIMSRWRVHKDCCHSVEWINSVRLQLYDPPNGHHGGYHPDPTVLKWLSDCRVEGMDIMVMYASRDMQDIRDLLNASEQLTGEI